jgi:hypothetical protein
VNEYRRAGHGAACRQTEAPFGTKCLLCVEKADNVRQPAGDRVRRCARVSPLDLVVRYRVSQQICLGLGERPPTGVAEGGSLFLVGKVDLVEREDRGAFVYGTRRRAAFTSRGCIIPPDVEIGASKGSVCPLIVGNMFALSGIRILRGA